MNFIKMPMKGMRDILPNDMELREYVRGIIKETYSQFGYRQIDTPCIEHIENLTSNQGGENEQLIFKILKRGEKLNINNIHSENDLVDGGLRYDLTVPLARYYANNIDNLPYPFKAFQIGNVWRADRPQRGRFRQFIQCDIDILGESSNLAETDLIVATTSLLKRLNFKDFKVRINDRRILKGIALYSGFTLNDLNQVFISLDKMDKIGREGVFLELKENGYNEDYIEKYLDIFKGNNMKKPSEYLGDMFTDYIDNDVIDNLDTIIDSVKNIIDCDIVFDPTLVRGMGYYTGPIFEIEIEGFPGSIAGGGRYDEMVGKYTNMLVSACGFSIGFERLITILLESNFKLPDESQKVAVLLDRELSQEKVLKTFKSAQQLRREGKCVLITYKNKNAKYQREQLLSEGYTNIQEIKTD
ncbi:MAG: histidine--tRNA ligase [Bacilli bacterium]|nr:histidine--tRNA ligase [Bacilli bacterium]